MLAPSHPLETGHSRWIITKYPAILWAMLLVLVVYNSLKKSRLLVLCHVSYVLNIKLSDDNSKMKGEEYFCSYSLNAAVWRVFSTSIRCLKGEVSGEHMYGFFATSKKVARLVSVTSVLEWFFEEKWQVWGGSIKDQSWFCRIFIKRLASRLWLYEKKSRRIETT